MSGPTEARTGLHAWVDESGSDQRRDPGTYILAAAITSEASEDHMRQAMVRLRLPGQRKLHWHDEKDRRRRQISTAIASLEQTHLVVVRASDPSDTQKRRRNKCLERLLVELEMRGVTHATFESRGPADDRRDLDLVQALRGTRRLSPSLRIDHLQGPKEPLLWVPDAVCGAVTTARITSDEYLEILGEQVAIVQI